MIWLIGVGYMGGEYAKVLNALNEKFIAIGRGEESAIAFEHKTGVQVERGGLEVFLSSGPQLPQAAIVSVNVENLAETTKTLLRVGVKKILLEKPGIEKLDDIDELVQLVREKEAKVLLAYNRRFYSAVIAAEKIIEQDGGVTSFNFEFTEWTHVIDPQKYKKEVLNYWLLANSSHVIDLAFFLGGSPKEMSCYVGGQRQIEWHPQGTMFYGAGISEKGALFGYQANWLAPGRWSVEILTRKHRLYFKPMESLQIQNIGSVTVTPVEIDNRLDIEYKPGLYLETKSFIEEEYGRFCSIEQQKEHIDKFYKKMANY